MRVHCPTPASFSHPPPPLASSFPPHPQITHLPSLHLLSFPSCPLHSPLLTSLPHYHPLLLPLPSPHSNHSSLLLPFFCLIHPPPASSISSHTPPPHPPIPEFPRPSTLSRPRARCVPAVSSTLGYLVVKGTRDLGQTTFPGSAGPFTSRTLVWWYRNRGPRRRDIFGDSSAVKRRGRTSIKPFCRRR